MSENIAMDYTKRIHEESFLVFKKLKEQYVYSDMVRLVLLGALNLTDTTIDARAKQTIQNSSSGNNQ